MPGQLSQWRKKKRASKRVRSKVKKRRQGTKSVKSDLVAYNKFFNVSNNMPFKSKIKAQLRYAASFSINPAVGGLAATHVMSLNGLFDPDITGVGHQPMGFDQLMAVYSHYTVIGARALATFANEDSARPILAGMYVAEDSTPLTDRGHIIEQGRGVFCRLEEQGSGDGTRDMELVVNPNQFLGRSNPLSEDDLRGIVSANPTEQCYLHVWAAPNSTVDAGNINCLLVIEYTAIFTEPRKIVQS